MSVDAILVTIWNDQISNKGASKMYSTHDSGDELHQPGKLFSNQTDSPYSLF